ncbi:MAG: guanylate kinase [Elusimicrobia bacterium]|nr:guanylate kinase [Elusimicrobiota bacterium]
MKNSKFQDVIENKDKTGTLIVISGPSGAGKSTLCRMLVDDLADSVYSISTTSRPPRPGETDKKDYFFIYEGEFKKLIEDKKLLEWAIVHGHYYGTSKDFIEKSLKSRKYVILDVDVQGGVQIRKEYPRAVLIFIMTPTMKELEKRLTGRKQDSAGEIKKRLENSYKELDYIENYGYLVINDRVQETLNILKCIAEAEKHKI